MTMNLKVIAATTLLGLALSTSALACSICRCGDPTFNALGKEGISLPGLRLALDWEEVQKSEGIRDEGVLLRARTPHDATRRLGRFRALQCLRARAYAERDLVEIEDGETEREHAGGLADPKSPRGRSSLVLALRRRRRHRSSIFARRWRQDRLGRE
jgi:hypothetical protein